MLNEFYRICLNANCNVIHTLQFYTITVCVYFLWGEIELLLNCQIVLHTLMSLHTNSCSYRPIITILQYLHLVYIVGYILNNFTTSEVKINP